MRFTYIWEFEVAEENTEAFLQHYAPGGTWCRLFSKDPAYIESLLLKDDAVPSRYLTVDRWKSASAYREFRNRFAQEYAALDATCEGLTRSERALGHYEEVE